MKVPGQEIQQGEDEGGDDGVVPMDIVWCNPHHRKVSSLNSGIDAVFSD